MTAGLRGRSIAVIGAGIAGLTVAVALARHGAQIRVFERADALRTAGAGIQISPNAMRVLDAVDLGARIRGAALQSRAVQLRDATGAPVARLNLATDAPDDAGFHLIHRARLIAILADAAQAAGAALFLNSQRDDAPAGADLTIGADGLHSRLRQVLNGREVPFFTHQTAWRAIIPDTDADTDPQAQIFMGPRRHLVSYPLPDGLRNIVAVQERHDWHPEGWSHPGNPDELRTAFRDFGGPVPDWLSRIEETHLWGLFRHPVAPVWHDDRRVLIGDAAHPTLPFMAQGAVMAIEDAWHLSDCLSQIAHQPTALARFHQMRLPRVTRIVQTANDNARNYHLTGPKRLAAHAILRTASRLAPRRLTQRYDWIYSYNPLTTQP